MSHKKFGPDRFGRFDVYWIQTDKQTNRQTDRQAKFIYRFEPRLKSAKNRLLLSAGLNLEKFNTILSGTNHI